MHQKRDVLVVGDWYVDAHWVVAPHESATASRPGERHSLAVHGVDATVRVLCGAGQVASILHAGFAAPDPGRRIYGLGSWSLQDDGFIQALVRGDNEGDNPLKLKSAIREVALDGPADRERRVFNLSKDAGTGTNRVIRIYRRTSATHFRLVERIDFATRGPKAPLVVDDTTPLPQSIGHVLVKDHGHGVITPELLEAIKKRIGEACWYVSTKRWPVESTHDWLGVLRDADVRLILLQHEAAERAVTTDDVEFPEVGNWFIEGKAPTRKALTAIDGVLAHFMRGRNPGITEPIVVVLPTRESLIARIPNRPDSARGYVHIGPIEKPHEAFVPRASALFAAMFYASARDDSSISLAGLEEALEFTQEWVQNEAERITNSNWIRNSVIPSYDRQGSIVKYRDEPAATRPRPAKPREHVLFDWNRVRHEYEQAFTAWPRPQSPFCGYGIIRRGDTSYLELWRAMSDAPGAISILRAKRRMIGQLSREFDQFIRTKKSNKSFMIVDNPGGGKSTLIKSLASARRLAMLSVNITELTRREDLLAFFDTVVTTQARDDRPLLIFVDEINALLEGEPVYASFLAPLEDGHYNRDGKSFTIQPCIWVFVGTDDLTQGRADDGLYSLAECGLDAEREYEPLVTPRALRYHREQRDESDVAGRDRTDRAQKRSDFLSRLTLPPFVLNRTFVGGDHADARKMVTFAGILRNAPSAEVRDEELAAIDAALDDSRMDDQPDGLARRILGRRLLSEGHALERVYIGASMITQMYPSVEAITLRVLMAFAHVNESYTLRDLRHDLDRMTNVQHNQITWDNLSVRFHRHKSFVRLNDGRLTKEYGTAQRLAELCPREYDEILVRISSSPSTDLSLWTGVDGENRRT
jgi:hypothetical protein